MALGFSQKSGKNQEKGNVLERERKASSEMETSEQAQTKKGGLRSMPFIISNEVFEKVASFGLRVNMILYLKNEYHLENTKAATILFLFSALLNFTPIIGAFVSDSYFGRFKVIGGGTLISLLGLLVLLFTAVFPQARPPHCDFPAENCISPSSPQLMLLLSSLSLMAIGAGGIRPCSLAFGADQLKSPENPKGGRVLQSFFNWYYTSVGISVMISVTFIVYIQNRAGWTVGYGVSLGIMLFSTIMFFVGSSLYVMVEPNKSLLSGFARVIVSAWKNRHFPLPTQSVDSSYYQKGSRLVAPTEKLRFLNKACIVKNTYKDSNSEEKSTKTWNICTVDQVEELKSLIKVLPIWSTGIMIAVATHQFTYSTLQATTMNRQITSHFEFPAASFAVFSILTLTIWVLIYDRFIVPHLSKFTKQPCRLSLKQRMGIGLAISCLASGISAEVERHRRQTAFQQGVWANPKAVVNMSAMWLVPQHCLAGLAEAFNAIGQIEFYYSEFPESMSSIAMALLSLGMAFGNFAGALLVNVINGVTEKGGKVSWLSSNLNEGHYDYYYWILTLLGLLNFFYYLLCSWLYGKCELEEETNK